jgi:predicted transcriptional regulator/DNA-binding XRE family transcriptional regulator
MLEANLTVDETDVALLGRQIRHHRTRAGLTLQQLSKATDCAISQLSLIENGKREPRITLLKKIASALGVGTEQLLARTPPSRRAELEIALKRAQSLPAYAQLGLPEIRISKSLPDDVLESLVGMHEEMARRASVAAATPEEARRANVELRTQMRKRDNYFGEIEQEAQRILEGVDHAGGPVGERRINQIAEFLGFSLHTVTNLPHSTRSVTDLRHNRIYMQEGGWSSHDPRAITLQTLGHHVLGHRAPANYAEFLRQRIEVNYFAAAIMMPEQQAAEMLKRAKDGRYLAVEDFRDAFSVSYEMAAHRFTNLITKHLGLTVHLVKLHESGTIYKAYENNGLAFPTDPTGAIEGQVACRYWPSRQIFTAETGGLSYSQYTDTPQGTFWASTQKEVTRSGIFSISVGTTFDGAKWFRGRETTLRLKSTCPDPGCCRKPDNELTRRWSGAAWPSARVHAHLLAALPPGTFPGVDEAEVFQFLEDRSAEFDSPPSVG